MGFTLVLVSPPQKPAVGVEVKGRVFVLGRGEGVDVSLPEPTVSRRHACLKKRGPNYLITDEGSTNGTQIVAPGGGDPVFLAIGAPRVVQEGDRIRLGHVEFSWTASPDDDVEIVEDPEDLPARLVRAALIERGIDASDERVAEALRELEGSDDEPLHGVQLSLPVPAPPSTPLEDPKNDPRVTDALLFSFALVVLAGGLLALAWLLGFF